MHGSELYCRIETPKGAFVAQRAPLERWMPSPADCCYFPDTMGSAGQPLEAMVCSSQPGEPGGRVTVSGCCSEAQVVVKVADTGVGIPGKYRPFLFDEFFRIKGEGAKRTSGTGLGLHISKKIVSEMGGSIEVESEVNVGSTFRVRLPAWVEQQEEGKV